MGSPSSLKLVGGPRVTRAARAYELPAVASGCARSGSTSVPACSGPSSPSRRFATVAPAASAAGARL